MTTEGGGGGQGRCRLDIKSDSVPPVPNVLIRDVPIDDLAQIRAAAAQSGASLQAYLRATVQAQATYLRRQAALARTADRLRGRPDVPPSERAAVLDAIASAHLDRAEQLSEPSTS